MLPARSQHILNFSRLLFGNIRGDKSKPILTAQVSNRYVGGALIFTSSSCLDCLPLATLATFFLPLITLAR